MPKSPHPHLDRVQELEAKVEAAKSRPHELRAERNLLARERDHLKDDLARLFAQVERGDAVDKDADETRKVLAEVESKLLTTPWDESLRGSELAAGQAESEFAQFVADHHEELQGEIEATLAQASHVRLVAAVGEFAEAIAQDEAVRHLQHRYLLIGDRANEPARRPAPNPLANFQRDLRRLEIEGGLQPPALREPADEDPTIRAEQFNGAAVVRR